MYVSLCVNRNLANESLLSYSTARNWESGSSFYCELPLTACPMNLSK